MGTKYHIFDGHPKQIFGTSYFVRALIEIAHRKTYVQSFFVYCVTYFSMVSCSWERVKAPTPAMVKCSKAGKNMKKRVKFSRFREIKTPNEFRIGKIMPKAKGQLISEANFKVFIWTKNRTKIFLYFCPSSLKWVKSKTKCKWLY